MPFKKIGLCDELVQGILATGYTAPTEIQAEAIPVVIEGKDMIGCAQTGTGKTAAFVLPILNRISQTGGKTKRRKLRSLILSPTRELAMQIDNSIKGYGRFMKISSLAVYGGTQISRQTKVLRKGVDIVVATPGRLIDHVNRGNIDLSTVEMLVLDEADRMLDMGFVNDIKNIIAEMPADRQTLLFSATMDNEVAKLTQTIQNDPKIIQIGGQNNPIDTITQHIYPVMREQKMELLLHMIKSQNMYSVLVFSRTKRGADKICRKLRDEDIKAEAIHSDRTQRQRLRALDGFKRGKYQVMVATDIAARGINVEGISHVFNYDVPVYPEDYVHRIGRTGRAEATGDAITFVADDEMRHLNRIEEFIGQTFEGEYCEEFEYMKRISLTKGKKLDSSGKKKNAGSFKRKNSQGKADKKQKTSDKKKAGFGKRKNTKTQAEFKGNKENSKANKKTDSGKWKKSKAKAESKGGKDSSGAEKNTGGSSKKIGGSSKNTGGSSKKIGGASKKSSSVAKKNDSMAKKRREGFSKSKRNSAGGKDGAAGNKSGGSFKKKKSAHKSKPKRDSDNN